MRRGRGRTVPAAVLAALVAAGCAGSARLAPGDRVRVASARFDTGPVEGTVVALDRDSLRLRPTPGSQSMAVPRRDIDWLEVARGRTRHTAWGALAGAVVAGVAGAQVGAQSCGGDDTPLAFVCPAEGALLFAVPGAGLGALVGYFIRGEERWERLRPDAIQMDASGAPR